MPHSTDVRAAKTAAALAGDEGAVVINLNSFVVGAVFGVALGLGLAYVYAAGFQIGRDLHVISQVTDILYETEEP